MASRGGGAFFRARESGSGGRRARPLWAPRGNQEPRGPRIGRCGACAVGSGGGQPGPTAPFALGTRPKLRGAGGRGYPLPGGTATPRGQTKLRGGYGSRRWGMDRLG